MENCKVCKQLVVGNACYGISDEIYHMKCLLCK